MTRLAVYTAIAAAAFAVTVHLRKAGQLPETAATSAANRERSEREAAPARDAAARPTTSPAIVRVAPRREVLTPFQRALEQQPTETTALRNAVLMATARARHERGANLEDCATAVKAPGPQRLRFRIHVSSTGDRFETESWRFVEVIDGTSLDPDIISCMEQVLGGPYRGDRPDYAAFLADFDGELEMVYRLQSFRNGEQ